MTKDSERLVAFGFTRKGADSVQLGDEKIKIEGKTPQEKLDFIKKKRDELKDKAADFDKALEKIAEHHELEVAKDQLLYTEYPDPISCYQMSLESWHQSIETYYYWCLNFLGDLGFPVIDKINDCFSAAEQSSFYGASGQRLGLAQDKIGSYLATIGKMIKDLFQLVREMRWIDERLEIYRGAFGIDKEGKPLLGENGKPTGPRTADELSLKGLWVDLVDGVVGGQRTGSNLFNMATQLQFTALPDLFFNVSPLSGKDVDRVVKEQLGEDFNEQVKNVLKRKLTQYLAWKEATFAEMKNRRKFTLDYLYQHYNVIKLYKTWIRPYLKHVERLTGQEDLLGNARLISSFESNLVEIEILARTRPAKVKEHYACILLTFEYHTKPQMQYPGDQGYHRGPIHVGTTRITWRSYAWNDEQIKNYIAMRDHEDLKLLESIDANLKSAMEQLGKDIETYLEEAKGLKKEEPKKEEKKGASILEPFTAVGKGFAEAFGSLIPGTSLPSFLKGSGKKTDDKEKKKDDQKTASGTAKALAWAHYNVFKKAHGLLSW